MRNHLGARTIAVIYGVAAGAWILASDAVVAGLYPTLEGVEAAQTIKGLVFITATALLVYVLVRRSQAATDASLQWYRELFDLSADAVFVVGPDGRFRDANAVAVSRYGYRRDEFLTMGPRDLAPPDLLPRIAELTNAARRSGVEFEWRHRTRDGTELPVLIASRPIPLPDGPGHLSCVRDMTQHRRSEEALRGSEERFRTLVEGAPDAVFIQAKGRFAYLNPQALTLFGAASPDELVDTPILERFHPDVRAQVAERIERVNFAREGIPPREETILRLDGTVVVAEVSAAPITFDGADGAVVFARDVSERVRHRREVDSLEAQLRQAQKMEAVGQLAGGVAHDFNNLLMVITGNVDLAIDGFPPGTDARHSLEQVQTASTRATDLVRQLLTFSRRQVMQPLSLDLNEVVRSFLRLLERVIGERIRVEFVPGHQLPDVRADRGMLEQVLMNLSVNARDAMPEGGVLTLETQAVVFDGDYCRTHLWARPGRYLLLSVTDTGHGMDAATMTHLFEPFFTTKEEGLGTGLGLATVYGIVTQHEGMIQTYSEPDRGTCFKVYLPAGEILARNVAPAIEGPVHGGTETLLLAEDDAAVRGLSLRILSAAGYEVLVAASGEEALALFDEHGSRIRLALLDVVMPGLGGQDVADRLHATRPGLPVLFTSGYSQNGIHTGFVLSEGVRLLQKPFGRDDLLRAVRTALDGVSSPPVRPSV